MSEVSYFTAEGLDKLKKEITYLKTKGRAEIARQIQEAREKGDLSENAEYDAAKEAQGHHEMKIAKLETMLANARLLDISSMDASQVVVLSNVKVKNMQTGQTVLYTLVSEKEADIKSGKISVSSPIGKGLLGKKINEIAEVNVPSGTIKFKILSIAIG